MLGKKSSVVTRITVERPPIYCCGHSLTLAVKKLISSCKVLGDTMGTVGEICALVKFSPKRENLWGTIWEQLEGKFDDENNAN